MKDRIKKIMESQHMTQQEFANFLQISPAALSSIFTGRTRPTLVIIEAIHKNIPNISLSWILTGAGEMYDGPSSSAPGDTAEASTSSRSNTETDASPMLNFDDPEPSPTSATGKPSNQVTANPPIVDGFPKSTLMVNKIDKPQRTITEIRIFYSDQTWETFIPKK